MNLVAFSLAMRIRCLGAIATGPGLLLVVAPKVDCEDGAWRSDVECARARPTSMIYVDVSAPGLGLATLVSARSSPHAHTATRATRTHCCHVGLRVELADGQLPGRISSNASICRPVSLSLSLALHLAVDEFRREDSTK
jgi:hypothetical protein